MKITVQDELNRTRKSIKQKQRIRFSNLEKLMAMGVVLVLIFITLKVFESISQNANQVVANANARTVYIATSAVYPSLDPSNENIDLTNWISVEKIKDNIIAKELFLLMGEDFTGMAKVDITDGIVTKAYWAEDNELKIVGTAP